MFITRAIEKGIDVKVIASWQGHRDGGKLILDTYSHVRQPHADAMARLMGGDEERSPRRPLSSGQDGKSPDSIGRTEVH
jgi:hypothetical protein